MLPRANPQKDRLISTFSFLYAEKLPPFQGGGTGSNPVGCAAENIPQPSYDRDCRLSASDRELPA